MFSILKRNTWNIHLNYNQFYSAPVVRMRKQEQVALLTDESLYVSSVKTFTLNVSIYKTKPFLVAGTQGRGTKLLFLYQSSNIFL